MPPILVTAMSHTPIDDNPFINSPPHGKVHPTWGFTQYKNPGCTSFRVMDDRMHQKYLNIVTRGSMKLREASTLLKLTRNPCLNCLYLHDGSCPYSKDELIKTAKLYKKSPTICRHCGSTLINFHYFLLQEMGGRGGGGKLYTCEVCKHAEQKGTLSEHLKTRQKDERLTKRAQFFELLFIVLLFALQISFNFYEDSAIGVVLFYCVVVAFFISFILFLVFTAKSMRAHRKIRQNLKHMVSTRQFS